MEYQGKKRGKEGVRSALQLAQQSTASMGRFDEMRDGEPLRCLIYLTFLIFIRGGIK